MADKYVKASGTAVDPFNSWTTAANTIEAALNATDIAAGDRVYVDSAYNHDNLTTVTLNAPASSDLDPAVIISTDDTTNEPPTSYAAGAAQDASNSGQDINFTSSDKSYAFFGITFAAADRLTMGGHGGVNLFVDCTFDIATGIFSQTNSMLIFIRCTFNFSATSTPDFFVGGNSGLELRDCVFTTQAVSTPAGPMYLGSRHLVMTGCDFSGMGTNFEVTPSSDITENTRFEAYNNLLPTGGTIGNPGQGSYLGFLRARGNGPSGGVQEETDISMGGNVSGGTSGTDPTLDATHDGTTKYSRKFVGQTARVFPGLPSNMIRYMLWEGYAAANSTFTVHAFGDHATQLTKREFFIEVEYPDATNAQHSRFDESSGDVELILGTAANVTTEADPGWADQGSPTNARFYAPAATISGGAAGMHRVWVRYGSTQTLFVDPAVDVT